MIIFPRREAGYFHTWNYLYDAELAFKTEEAVSIMKAINRSLKSAYLTGNFVSEICVSGDD
ncbi:MAG: hypothetical protein ACTSWE_11375 [Promethearchaeota archaeon]